MSLTSNSCLNPVRERVLRAERTLNCFAEPQPYFSPIISIFFFVYVERRVVLDMNQKTTVLTPLPAYFRYIHPFMPKSADWCDGKLYL